MRTTTAIFVCGLAAFGSAGANAQAQTRTKPAPAPQLLLSAQKRAAKERKNVLVVFGSSWCGWCHRLDDVMARPAFKKLFADNYVVVSLDVRESGAKKALENPGGDEVLSDLGGANSGLPFYAVVSAKGAKLADSNAVPGPNGTRSNIGYPASPAEIAAFDDLLRKTAPRMKTGARQKFIAYLKQNSPH